MKLDPLRYDTFKKSFLYCIEPQYHQFAQHKFTRPLVSWLPAFAKSELQKYNSKAILKISTLCLYAIPVGVDDLKNN